ncbi:hypothetical protein SEMRO_2456_G328200.1 [Seminavis robusta]|uniref:Uncharacterized protein n=1 Tax=Seminavis robusta TaxID=568900 RepID=A0A9N8F2M8_9STRA|nr:hypothetical protein SEMRO_2456_G328200.1 [Seminavis robusta]|eukprot:Sro2456_g328200.1 n/a (167) ;mRNA; r:5266-5869
MEKDDQFYINPYTGKPLRKKPAQKPASTMVHPETHNDDEVDLISLFNTGAHKNRNAAKRKPSISTGSVATEDRARTRRKTTKTAVSSAMESVPEMVDLNNSEDNEEVEDDEGITAASSYDFETKVKAIIDYKIGDDLEIMSRTMPQTHTPRSTTSAWTTRKRRVRT